MKSFKKFYVQDPASINHTSTKQVSYRYTPQDYVDSYGNNLANIVGTESEEQNKRSKHTKIKDLKKKKFDK